ncbi:MAG: hypothetical protein Q9160_006189 [Pyrenula sp. 1 TL-2023]
MDFMIGSAGKLPTKDEGKLDRLEPFCQLDTARVIVKRSEDVEAAPAITRQDPSADKSTKRSLGKINATEVDEILEASSDFAPSDNYFQGPGSRMTQPRTPEIRKRPRIATPAFIGWPTSTFIQANSKATNSLHSASHSTLTNHSSSTSTDCSSPETSSLSSTKSTSPSDCSSADSYPYEPADPSHSSKSADPSSPKPPGLDTSPPASAIALPAGCRGKADILFQLLNVSRGK